MKIKTGAQVEIEMVNQAGEVERQVFIIVPDQFADYAHRLLGENTPLAQALMGRIVGEEIPYRLADLVCVRILAAQPALGEFTADAAAQREADYRQALADFEKRNAAAFAASFSGKWGDYDPDGIEKWEKEPQPKDDFE